MNHAMYYTVHLRTQTSKSKQALMNDCYEARVLADLM